MTSVLQTAKVDVNCVDNDGKTLVAATVAAGLSNTTLAQLKYLHKHGADCARADAQANTPLHHLTVTDMVDDDVAIKEAEKIVKRVSIEHDVATFLIGTDKSVLNAVNTDGLTALDLAVAAGKTSLALTLARGGGTFALASGGSDDNSVNTFTFMHRLIMQGVTLADKDSGKGQHQSSSFNIIDHSDAVIELFNMLYNRDAATKQVCNSEAGVVQ